MCGKTSEKRNRNNTIHNRSNTTETAHNTYILYTHPLPFRPIAVCIGVRTLHPSLHFCFVHVEFDIARLLLLWSVLLLHHAGSRSHPGWGEGIYGRIGYSKAGIVCEGSFRHLEELLTASSCTNSEYQR